jgi:hypothetical protein
MLDRGQRATTIFVTAPVAYAAPDEMSGMTPSVRNASGGIGL